MKPWLTDPKYGGMSELAAERSYRAWLAEGGKNRKQGFKIQEPWTDEEWARKKLEIETMMTEYEQAIQTAAQWSAEWRAKKPKGFRALRGDGAAA